MQLASGVKTSIPNCHNCVATQDFTKIAQENLSNFGDQTAYRKKIFEAIQHKHDELDKTIKNPDIIVLYDLPDVQFVARI